MHLKELKDKSPQELLTWAEDLGVEDASSMRVQDLVFAIMKKVASEDNVIYGDGVIEVLQDGFGFLRSSKSNYLAFLHKRLLFLCHVFQYTLPQSTS